MVNFVDEYSSPMDPIQRRVTEDATTSWYPSWRLSFEYIFVLGIFGRGQTLLSAFPGSPVKHSNHSLKDLLMEYAWCFFC